MVTPPVIPAQPPPLPPSKRPFAFQAAKTSWLAPILAVGVSVVINGALGRDLPRAASIVGSFCSILFIASGLVFSIVALCGVPRHGKRGILIPAVAGVCINGLLVAFMIISIPIQKKIAERAREMRSEQAQQQESESPENDSDGALAATQIDRKTFSMSLPAHWMENTKDDLYDPNSCVFFEGPESCFFNVTIGKKATGVSIDAFVENQNKMMRQKFTDITTSTKISRWSNFSGDGIEIVGKPAGLIRSRVRFFAFENDESVCLVVEFGTLADLQKYSSDFELIRQTFNLKNAAPSVSGQDVSALYIDGVQKIRKGDSLGALGDFDKIIELKPDYAEAYNERARARIDFGTNSDNVTMILADLNKAIELKTNFVDPYFGRGVIEQKTGRLDEAIADYDKVTGLELKPFTYAAYANRGVIRAARNDWLGAMQDYDKAISLKPSEAASVYRLRAVLKQTEGDPNGALTDFNRSIEMQPDQYITYAERGNLRKAMGDTVGAQADYKTASVLKARDVHAQQH